MDLRKFFGSSSQDSKKISLPTTSTSSALSAVRKERSSQQGDTDKKREEKIKTKLVTNIIAEEDSDGECPVPRSVRKTMSSSKQPVKKRSRVVLSDSDDDIPVPPSPTKLKSKSPSITPVKSRSKRSKVLISDDEDEQQSTSKKVVHRSSEKKPQEDNDSDIEMLTGTDSEDEFVEKRKPVKKDKHLLPGQKKLTFTTQASKAPVNKETNKPLQHKPISAAEFFGGSQVGSQKQAEKKTTTEKHKTPSPSQKENTTKSTISKGSTVHGSARSDKDYQGSSKESNARSSPAKRQADVSKNTSSQKEKIAGQTNKDSSADIHSKESAEVSNSKLTEKNKVLKESEKGGSPAKNQTASKPLSSPKNKEDKLSKKEVPVAKKPVVVTSAKKPETVKAVAEPSTVVEPVLPWVDKYKPKNQIQLIGQHGDKSPMNKILAWLQAWAKHNLGEGAKIKKPKPGPWQKSEDGAPFKAVLLSGTPGIGKTTCAHMACESNGFKVVEMNASDVRNKKHLEAQVKQLTGSHQIEEYFNGGNATGKDDTTVKHVLIMDEVDGMSGNEDRAGLSELIQIIKDTKIPIICICNDRGHTKMRSLVNHCFDVRFPKPRLEQIRPRVMSILAQEKLKISKEEVDEIIELSGHDVRQTIYNLQMRAATVSGDANKVQQKDCAVNTFEAARKLLDTRTKWEEKQDMFFVDYGIMPLFVQENYLSMTNKALKPAESIAAYRRASEYISLGDLADRAIRSTGAWKLLNEQGMLGCVLPSVAVNGHLSKMIQFPSWLGKNSTTGKRQRLMRQLASHAHLKISADCQSLVTDYVPVLRNSLTRPLIELGKDGVEAVVSTMTEYDLVKDDAEAIAELAVWPFPGKIDPASKIQSTTKSALTRALNKEHRLLPYAADDITKGKKKAAAFEVEMDEDGNIVEKMEEDENGDGSDDEKEDLPKVVVKTTSATGRGGRTGGATRGRGAGRGRGK